MKKWLPFSLFCLLFIVALSACGGGENKGQEATANNENKESERTSAEGETNPVEIEFWHAMSGPHEEAMNALVEKFNGEHKNITIKPVNQGGYDDLRQKTMAAAKAKTLPAVAQTATGAILEYIANDLITPLNEFIEDSEKGLSEEELNDYVDVFRESSQWDDTYYSLPFSKSTRVLYYNKDILEENGVEVPKTWEEILKASEKLTKGKTIGMGFENSFELEFQGLLEQMGGVFIDEATSEAKFASEEGMKALSFMKEMIDDGLARTAGEDQYMSNPFGRGDVAMYIGSSAGIPHVGTAVEGNMEWSTAVLPTFEGKAATPFAGNDIVMFNQIDEAEQKAAWEFMKFLTTPEVTAEWSMKTGYLPVRYSAQELEEYKKYVEENPAYKAGPAQFDAGFFTARVKGGDAVRNIVIEEFETILLNEKSVEDGLADAQERSNAELKK